MKIKLPGIHHSIEVRFVTNRYLRKVAEIKGPDEEIQGLYWGEQGRIYIDKDLSQAKKVHALMHELVHHILDSTEDMKD